jgi:hypothetical protein
MEAANLPNFPSDEEPEPKLETGATIPPEGFKLRIVPEISEEDLARLDDDGGRVWTEREAI